MGLEFDSKDTKINPLMGWESSTDTMSEVLLKFSTKEKQLNMPKKTELSFKLLNQKKEFFVIKSYADNFLKN